MQRIAAAKGKNFPEAQILDWFTQIALALRHCHERRIIHRDLKAKNVFLTSKNFVKLGDFGIARMLAHTMDKAKTVVGTPYYLSPEIIQNKSYGLESDMWSLGVLLYEICTLKPPFDASSLSGLAMKIIRGTYPQIPAQYSKELKMLVASLLSIDPIKRPNIHKILRNPFIQSRIEIFMSQTVYNMQFTNTIISKAKGKPQNDEHKKVQDYLDKLREKAGPLHSKVQSKNNAIAKPSGIAQRPTPERQPPLMTKKEDFREKQHPSLIKKERPKEKPKAIPKQIDKKIIKPVPTPPRKDLTPTAKNPPEKQSNHKWKEDRKRMREEIEKMKRKNKGGCDVKISLVHHNYTTTGEETESSDMTTVTKNTDDSKEVTQHSPSYEPIISNEISPENSRNPKPAHVEKKTSGGIKDEIKKMRKMNKRGKSTLENFSVEDVLVSGANVMLQIEQVTKNIKVKDLKEEDQHQEDVMHMVNEMHHVFLYIRKY